MKKNNVASATLGALAVVLVFGVSYVTHSQFHANIFSWGNDDQPQPPAKEEAEVECTQNRALECVCTCENAKGPVLTCANQPGMVGWIYPIQAGQSCDALKGTACSNGVDGGKLANCMMESKPSVNANTGGIFGGGNGNLFEGGGS